MVGSYASIIDELSEGRGFRVEFCSIASMHQVETFVLVLSRSVSEGKGSVVLAPFVIEVNVPGLGSDFLVVT